MNTTSTLGATAESASRKLTLSDIADSRAYERDRADYRDRVMEIKRRRRVHLGTVVTLMFESRETMRFQIQEMARVERIMTDEGIQEELDTYNVMVPEPGQLCATLFIELTSDDELREWLPKLVGIERSIVLHLPDGTQVRCVVDAQHAARLTREHVTSAVHYVTFELSADQVDAFADGVVLAIDHPAYMEQTELSATTVAELRADLLGE
jgi:hypothetical protein